MTMRLALCTLLLAACGTPAPSFDGVWAGTLTKSATCSDGPRDPVRNDKRVTIVEDGPKATIDPGDCPGIRGDVSGSLLRVSSAGACPTVTSPDGTTFTVTIEGGTMTLGDAGLVLDLTASDVRTPPGGAGVTCTSTIRGTLVRQP